MGAVPGGRTEHDPARQPPAVSWTTRRSLLFLELKKQGLRNCSPNNCDDKGAEVTATVRRLLIGTADLDKIIAAANALGSGLTSSDLDAALSAKLNLPDLRVLRFDVLELGPGDVQRCLCRLPERVPRAQAGAGDRRTR